MNIIKSIALTAVVATTVAACTPPKAYTDYANTVNAEREELNLTASQWSPTEKKVMTPVILAIGASIVLAPTGNTFTCTLLNAGPLPGGGYGCVTSGA
jgi:hypothetical protein